MAAGFAGLSATISLQDTIEQLLGIRLEKGETRTNWLQRPLTDKQIVSMFGGWNQIKRGVFVGYWSPNAVPETRCQSFRHAVVASQ